jgi:hypothetical protein
MDPQASQPGQRPTHLGVAYPHTSHSYAVRLARAPEVARPGLFGATVTRARYRDPRAESARRAGLGAYPATCSPWPGETTGVARGTGFVGGASGTCTTAVEPSSNVNVTVANSPGEIASVRPVSSR